MVNKCRTLIKLKSIVGLLSDDEQTIMNDVTQINKTNSQTVSAASVMLSIRQKCSLYNHNFKKNIRGFSFYFPSCCSDI